MTDTNGSGPPAVPTDFLQKMMRGIAQSRVETRVAGGKPFFRMDKSGEWIFGQANEEVQPGSRWAANIYSFVHGYSCWVDTGQKNELLGEVMTSMSEPLPPKPAPIQGTEYKPQRGFELKCLDGVDTGTEAIYKTNSLGGIKAILALLPKVEEQLATNPHYPCPVLTFENSHYIGKKYGKTYEPVINVVGWADMNGNLEGSAKAALPPAEGQAAAAPEAKPAKPAKPKKAALAADKAPLEVVAAVAEPAPTARVHTGQRKRPV
jgi:hypothetical protein